MKWASVTQRLDERQEVDIVSLEEKVLVAASGKHMLKVRGTIGVVIVAEGGGSLHDGGRDGCDLPGLEASFVDALVVWDENPWSLDWSPINTERICTLVGHLI